MTRSSVPQLLTDLVHDGDLDDLIRNTRKLLNEYPPPPSEPSP